MKVLYLKLKSNYDISNTMLSNYLSVIVSVFFYHENYCNTLFNLSIETRKIKTHWQQLNFRQQKAHFL